MGFPCLGHQRRTVGGSALDVYERHSGDALQPQGRLIPLLWYRTRFGTSVHGEVRPNPPSGF